jgi:hypothetical protein
MARRMAGSGSRRVVRFVRHEGPDGLPGVPADAGRRKETDRMPAEVAENVALRPTAERRPTSLASMLPCDAHEERFIDFLVEQAVREWRARNSKDDE